MNDIRDYQITLQGLVDESEINPHSPHQMEFRQVAGSQDDPLRVTGIRVRTDQSGIIGLLRYLHGKGLVFLSVRRSE